MVLNSRPQLGWIEKCLGPQCGPFLDVSVTTFWRGVTEGGALSLDVVTDTISWESLRLSQAETRRKLLNATFCFPLQQDVSKWESIGRTHCPPRRE